MTPDARQNRIADLQVAMADSGVDLLVLGPSANLRYAVGYRAMAVDRLTALLVSRENAVMILPDFDAAEFVEQAGFEAVETWTDRDGPGSAVKAAFDRLGLRGDTVQSVVDDELPFQFYFHLRGHLSPDPGLATDLVGPLRLVKSKEEQQRIARAGDLVSVGIDVAQEHAVAGMSELQLKRKIEEAMWDGGAESVDYVLVQAGRNSASPHHNADQTQLVEGEPVLIDIAVCLDGYFADITQQVFLGSPPREYMDAYEVVSAAQESGVVAARAGQMAGDVAGAASAVIVEAGYQEWNGPRTGHGLGLDVHEPPSVVEGSHTELRPGTVITVEPGVYLSGRYGIRIEDTVLVTEDDPQRLTRGARELYAK